MILAMLRAFPDATVHTTCTTQLGRIRSSGRPGSSRPPSTGSPSSARTTASHSPSSPGDQQAPRRCRRRHRLEQRLGPRRADHRSQARLLPPRPSGFTSPRRTWGTSRPHRSRGARSRPCPMAAPVTVSPPRAPTLSCQLTVVRDRVKAAYGIDAAIAFPPFGLGTTDPSAKSARSRTGATLPLGRLAAAAVQERHRGDCRLPRVARPPSGGRRPWAVGGRPAS